MALRGGVGEKAVRQIIEHARAVAERAIPADKEHISRLCSDISTMTSALCELRQDGKGASPQVYRQVHCSFLFILIIWLLCV